MTRLRFLYCKDSELALFSHLDLWRALARLLRRADLPVEFSCGYHPRPRISMGPSLPLGATGEEELCDIYLEDSPEVDILDRLNAAAPPGLHFKKSWVIEGKASALTANSFLSSWIFKGSWERRLDEEEFGKLTIGHFFIQRLTPKGTKEVDIGLYLRALGIAEGLIRAEVLSTPSGGCRPEEIIGFLAEKGFPFSIHSLHRKHLHLLGS